MTDSSKISELIERSSLGTAGARSLRDRTPSEVTRRILSGAADHERTSEHVRANPSSAADLLRGIGDGRPEAWDEVFRQYGKLVAMTVRAFRLQEDDTLDVIQMTWLRLAENAHRIQFPDRLGGWLVTTARRECLRTLRQIKCSSDLVDVAPDKVADPSVDPEPHVIDTDTAETLRRLIAELPPRRRTLVRMLFTDQPSSYAEVARTAGIPPGGVRPTRAQALRQLRRCLAAAEVC